MVSTVHRVAGDNMEIYLKCPDNITVIFLSAASCGRNFVFALYRPRLRQEAAVPLCLSGVASTPP